MSSNNSVMYVSRERVKAALELGESARADSQVDRAILGASHEAEGICNRVFYPWTGTRYKDWPARNHSFAWRLWLDEDELVSLTGLVSGGITIPVADVNLEPRDQGPPYTSVEIQLDSRAMFSAGPTFQRAVALTGVWGFDNRQKAAGILADDIATAGATTIDVSDGSMIGVGDTLVIDDERMTVVERTWLDSGQVLAWITASIADVTLALTDASGFAAGETVLVDSERMLIMDVSGNNLVAKRARDGSVIASHAGPPVYVSRRLTVERGALGTTAVAHAVSTPIGVQAYPPDLVNYVVAESLNTVMSEASGYARTIGSGEGTRNASGAGLDGVRERLYNSLARKARHMAI